MTDVEREKYTASEHTKITTLGFWAFYENDFGIPDGIYSWACNFGKEYIVHVYCYSCNNFEVDISTWMDETVESKIVNSLIEALSLGEKWLQKYDNKEHVAVIRNQ